MTCVHEHEARQIPTKLAQIGNRKGKEEDGVGGRGEEGAGGEEGRACCMEIRYLAGFAGFALQRLNLHDNGMGWDWTEVSAGCSSIAASLEIKGRICRQGLRP